MKKILFLFTAFLLFTQSSVFANQIVTLNNEKMTFDPVKWRITPEIGAISFTNQSDKLMFIQVAIDKGRVSTVSQGHEKNPKIACETTLEANTIQTSMICELLPNDTFYISLDMSIYPKPAIGSYQVAIAD